MFHRFPPSVLRCSQRRSPGLPPPYSNNGLSVLSSPQMPPLQALAWVRGPPGRKRDSHRSRARLPSPSKPRCENNRLRISQEASFLAQCLCTLCARSAGLASFGPVLHVYRSLAESPSPSATQNQLLLLIGSLSVRRRTALSSLGLSVCARKGLGATCPTRP